MDKQTPALTQPPPADRNDATETAAAAHSPVDDARVAADGAAETEAKGGNRPPPAAAETRPASGGGTAGLVIAVIALIVACVVGWQLFELRRASEGVRGEVAERLSGADARASESRALAREARESIEALQGRFGALESKVAASEGQAAAIESLYQELSRTRSERALAEVGQAITIAGQQLRLAGNFEAALIALQSAESRLSAPEFAHLHELRRALLKDIDAVKSHPQIDVSGIALRLELLFEHIDRLPLAYTVEPVGTPPAMDDIPLPVAAGEVDAPWWKNALGFARALGADAWNEMRGMIRLERMDEADPALLAPSQGVYLRENVKIRLLTARLALMAGDPRIYTADLAQARNWLGRYFDPRDTQVQRVITELEELQKVDMQAETPSLTDTFAALGMVRDRLAAGARSAAAKPIQSAEPVAEGATTAR